MRTTRVHSGVFTFGTGLAIATAVVVLVVFVVFVRELPSIRRYLKIETM
ncbi:DUF6893 family small protein [Goodfellowiella coeruleoviolacea]|uniref:Uncharacterized protein n=1 Tax=Goodfellowiella coeruleoviolacea TaxID=334858 RepID=A0AAE3KEL6_9PSEU|nr:hypothetical protein [Goodfellowiella coeruleoviolacea]MCP2163504.1 hypothetical protein [Goodfellowiella coeruleoviolacea]